MHPRPARPTRHAMIHALRYGSVAGVLAASVTLSGAATASTTSAGTAPDPAASGAASGSGDAKQVTVQPDPVAPGGEFSVLDGGNCTGGSGEASFEGAAIPKLPLSLRDNQVGGTGTVPQSTKPGTYTVTVTCGSSGPQPPGDEFGQDQGPAPAEEGDPAYGSGPAVSQQPGEPLDKAPEKPLGRALESDADKPAADGNAETDTDAGQDADTGADSGADLGTDSGAGEGADMGGQLGDGQQKFTGTLTVSGEARNAGSSDQVVPEGGSHTGLGGGSGSGLNTGITVLGGTLLAGALGWGVVVYRRRARDGRG